VSVINNAFVNHWPHTLTFRFVYKQTATHLSNDRKSRQM